MPFPFTAYWLNSKAILMDEATQLRKLAICQNVYVYTVSSLTQIPELELTTILSWTNTNKLLEHRGKMT